MRRTQKRKKHIETAIAPTIADCKWWKMRKLHIDRQLAAYDDDPTKKTRSERDEREGGSRGVQLKLFDGYVKTPAIVGCMKTKRTKTTQQTALRCESSRLPIVSNAFRTIDKHRFDIHICDRIKNTADMDNMFHFACFVAHAKAFLLILSFVLGFHWFGSTSPKHDAKSFSQSHSVFIKRERVKGRIVCKSTPYVWACVWHGASNVRIHSDFLSESAKPVNSAALCATFPIAHAAQVL